jgi:hypothetical protein
MERGGGGITGYGAVKTMGQVGRIPHKYGAVRTMAHLRGGGVSTGYGAIRTPEQAKAS